MAAALYRYSLENFNSKNRFLYFRYHCDVDMIERASIERNESLLHFIDTSGVRACLQAVIEEIYNI